MTILKLTFSEQCPQVRASTLKCAPFVSCSNNGEINAIGRQ
jgi:hypothetical protein